MGPNAARQVTIGVEPSRSDWGSKGAGSSERAPGGAQLIYQATVTEAQTAPLGLGMNRFDNKAFLTVRT
jgi:hypothetical protein